MMFALKYEIPDLQDRQKSGGRFIEILVNLDVVLRVFYVSFSDFSPFLFCIEILNPFLSPSKVPFELNEKPKLFV